MHNPHKARVVETYVVSHYLPEDLCDSKSTNSGDGRARGARHKFGRGMEPHSFADEAPCPVELQGSVAVDDPAARVALGADRRGELEEAVRPNGDAAVMAEIMVAESHSESEVHVAEPEGRGSSSRPAGYAHELLGGQSHHGGAHDPQAEAQEGDRECLVLRRKLINMTETARQKRVEELVGPRGGLPRVKGELQELCVLLSIEVANDDTVGKLKEKLRPMMDTMKGKATSPTSSATDSPKNARPSSGVKGATADHVVVEASCAC